MTSDPSQNVTIPRLDARRVRAARLVADDDLSDEDIAAEAGVSRRTLARWKLDPIFAAEVGGHVGALQAATLRLRVAKKRHRLKTLDTLYTKSLDVIARRAERYGAMLGDSPEVVAAQAAKSVIGGYTPGEAATGLLVEKETVNNAGHRTVEWSVDVGLMREIRAIEEQAARELGQWVEKGELDATGGIVREYRVVRSGPSRPQPVGFDDLDDGTAP